MLLNQIFLDDKNGVEYELNKRIELPERGFQKYTIYN